MNHLAVALVNAQREMENPGFDSQNPHFRSKYASLLAVCEAVIPVFNKHGISVTQWPLCEAVGDKMFAGCKTVLTHDTGERMEETCLLPLDKANAHGAGSCITYARRYSLMAVAGVVGDEDDDANASVDSVRRYAPSPTSDARENISAAQLAKVEQIANSALDAFTAGLPEEVYKIVHENALDSEEKLALWTYFDRTQRTTLKKIHDAKTKGAK